MIWRRQPRAAWSMNQEISASEVRPPHPMSNTNQWQHLSRRISEEPVYTDVKQEYDMAMTTENCGI